MALDYEIFLSHRVANRSVHKAFSKADWDRKILPILERCGAVQTFKLSTVSIYQVTMGHDQIMALNQELAAGYRLLTRSKRFHIRLK